MHDIDDFPQLFAAGVVVQLGGLEMANEFFMKHPDIVMVMRHHALAARIRGKDWWLGSIAFFKGTVQPRLKQDFRNHGQARAA